MYIQIISSTTFLWTMYRTTIEWFFFFLLSFIMHLQIHYLFTKFLLTGNLHMLKKQQHTNTHTHTRDIRTIKSIKKGSSSAIWYTYITKFDWSGFAFKSKCILRIYSTFMAIFYGIWPCKTDFSIISLWFVMHVLSCNLKGFWSWSWNVRIPIHQF